MMDSQKNIGRKITGLVVSDKMQETAVILSTRYVKHKTYGKYIKKEKRYKAHNPENKYKLNDKVVIQECKPISKTKRFKISKKV